MNLDSHSKFNLSLANVLFSRRKWLLAATLLFFVVVVLFNLLSSGNNDSSMQNLGSDANTLLIPLVVLFDSLAAGTLRVADDERADLSVKDLAIVTLASLNHMAEAIFRRIDELKQTPFIVYLHEDVPTEVEELYTQLCPIATVRHYPGPGYNPMLSDLMTYRFKAVLLAEVLNQHKVVLYVDSSLRANAQANSSFDDFIKTQVQSNPLDISLILSPGHKIFPATHPEMFKFFPKVNPARTQKIPQFGGGAQLWIGSEMGWKLLTRYLNCSLEPECMAPPGAVTTCNVTEVYNATKFSGCHRFDQAALNLILVQASKYNTTMYKANTDVIRLHRRLFD